MNINHPQNQSYWFVLREDQSNVIFSSNNFTIHNPQVTGQEARYIVDTSDRQYIQINETPTARVLDSTLATEDTLNEDNKEKDENTENTFWDRSKIKSLLTLCLENNFKNTSKDKDLLDDFSAHLGTTPEDCSIKYRNLRRTFIRLLKKKRLGKEIKWVHYNMCEKVFNDLPSSVLDPWDDYKVRNLLELYIQNLPKFRSSDCLQKDVWKDIAAQIGATEYTCYHKFKNLKRAYISWLQRSKDTGKPIKWPYQQYFERIFYNYTPSTGTWDKTKTRLLINAYLEIADRFKDPRYQKKDLWKQISIMVDESAQSCDKKFRNLKQTYLKLKMRADSGRSITKWRYYKDFESIYSPCSYWGTGNGRAESEDYIKELLQFYIENKDKFKDPRKKKKHVWRLLAPKIGLSPEACDRKFRNLKQTYIRLADKKKLTGYANKWPYYIYFEKIFDEPHIPNRNGYRSNSIQDIVLMSEVKRTVQHLQAKKDDDKFERLVFAIEESNNIQRERNLILKALLDKK